MGSTSHVKFRSAWEDPRVKQLLGAGEMPTDIWLIRCLECGNYGYYNLGSHFACNADGCKNVIDGDDLDVLIDNGEAITLADFADQEAFTELMIEVPGDMEAIESPRCRMCGCTNDRACPRGCYWVEPNLCSECAQ